MLQPKFLPLAVVFIFLFVSVIAQPQPIQLSAEQKKYQEERAKKASALLDEMIIEAQALKSLENKIYVQTTAAELLWKKDEKRARTLLQEATSSFVQLIKLLDSEEQSSGYQLQFIMQLRQEMLAIVARLDAHLAREFLRATRFPKTQIYPPQYDPEVQIELSLANQIAQNNPKEALQISRENLEKGLTGELTFTLNLLQSSDPKSAAELAGEILKKLRTENLLTNPFALNAATSLFNQASQNQSNENEPQAKPVSPSPKLLDDAALRELAELLTAAALTTSKDLAQQNRAQNVLTNLQEILPQLEKYAPNKAATLKARTKDLHKDPDLQDTIYEEFNKRMQSGSVESLLEICKNAPEELRGEFYVQVAAKANGEGKAELATQIINEHLTDPGQRKHLLDNFEQQNIYHAIETGKFDEANLALNRSKNNDQRTDAKIQLAMAIAAKGDKKKALLLLDEANRLINAMPEGQNQFYRLMNLAKIYAALDLSRSFEIVEPLVNRLNELITASAVLSGFQGENSFQAGEMRFQGGGFSYSLLTQYADALSSLANFNFEKTKAVADRFDRSEVRILIKLRLLQAVNSEHNANGNGAILRSGAVSFGSAGGIGIIR